MSDDARVRVGKVDALFIFCFLVTLTLFYPYTIGKERESAAGLRASFVFFDVCLRFKLVGKAEASVSDGQERAKQAVRAEAF